MPRTKIVRRTLADGTVRSYVYPAGGKPLATDPPGIRHLAAQWRVSPEWARLAEATQKHYLLRLDTLETRLGYLRLSELDDRSVKADFYRVRDELANRPATADATMAVLSSLLTWCVRRGLIDVNRARDIPKLDAKNKRAGIVLDPLDEPRLLAACAPDYRRMVQAALLTGLRLGDLCSLSRSHIGADGWLTLTPAKTRRWGIVVSLPPDVVERFAASGDILLPRGDGRRWTDTGANFRWLAARDAAGLSGLHFHDLRGTLATRLYDAGCSDAEANAVLGKTIAKGSMKSYVQRTRTMAENAYAKLFRVVDFRAEKKRVYPFSVGNAMCYFDSRQSGGGGACDYLPSGSTLSPMRRAAPDCCTGSLQRFWGLLRQAFGGKSKSGWGLQSEARRP